MRLYRWCVRATAHGGTYPVSLHWWLWGARATVSHLRRQETRRHAIAVATGMRYTGITYKVTPATARDRRARKVGAVR